LEKYEGAGACLAGSEMPKTIDRDEVARLMNVGVQLIDVLPKKEYSESHLPRAINIPLSSLNEEAVNRLQKDEPVIVYCYDYQ
jgi:rhodanese-related sulfurtransferase